MRVLCQTLLLGASLLVGCGEETTGPPLLPGDTITQLPRELSLNEQAVIARSNTFGFELVSRVAADTDRPNVIVSPLSASMALGMTLNGADGTTYDGMRSALGFDGMTREEINDAYRDLIELLTTLDPAVTFGIANAVFANEDVAFHDAFFDAVEAAFDARVEAMDFSDPASVDVINGWVAEQTDELIDRIVDTLSPDLIALLVNAIYFDAAWTEPFDPDDTHSADFTREDGSTVGVQMMSMNNPNVAVGFSPEYEAVELPYGGGPFSMVVVLPHVGTTPRELLSSLDEEVWSDLFSGLGPGSLARLELPKFTLEFDAFLNDPLKDMGMAEAFTPAANFSRMTPTPAICISFVRQKTFIEVDEQGTTAAAVTAAGVSVTSLPPSVIVDRPFLFAIRERLSGTLVFAGIVGDPTAEDPGPESAPADC